ncbi:hypothetical protein GCM10009817_20980 [Terrabacter lapilli]|uniref:EcsC family protein n=2 Tax=Terrabacter lapilli TaxID=436231 RepID=A0ABN2S4L0_9MICO
MPADTSTYGLGEQSQQRIVSMLTAGLDKAVRLQQPMVSSHVLKVRGWHPNGTPGDVIRSLEKQYLATVSGSGAAVGASAVAPGISTPVTIALAGGEIVASLNATMLYLLAVADVHGVALTDLERRRTLLLAVLLGQTGSDAVGKVAETTGKHWAKKIVQAVPMESIKKVNQVLGRNFVTKYGTKQGVLVLGKAVPFGIGIAIGGGANFLIGRANVAAARKAFGPPPANFADA